jgi:hypothetical protein
MIAFTFALNMLKTVSQQFQAYIVEKLVVAHFGSIPKIAFTGINRLLRSASSIGGSKKNSTPTSVRLRKSRVSDSLTSPNAARDAD